MNQNYEIFKYLDPNSNDMLTSLNNHDLEDLIYYLDKFYLEYRTLLKISEDITFGVEIECESECVSSEIISIIKCLLVLKDWNVLKDSSIINGCEINSDILVNNKECWEKLKNICLAIKDYVYIGQNASGHIHVGAHILGNENKFWLNFIKLWAVYERVIYRFVYGEYLTERSRLFGFAPLMYKSFLEDYEELKNSHLSTLDIVKKLSHGHKCQAVNFLNVSSCTDYKKFNTIEFRNPNGSINPVIWQNNINLFVHLLLYSKRNDYNQDVINGRIRDIGYQNINPVSCRQVYLSLAIELCDLIFDNNLDKIYFLRQYLKSYEVGTEYLELARTFVRK